MTKICVSEKKTPPLIIKSVVEKIKLQSKTLLICCQIKLSKICDESRSKHMAYEVHEFGKYSTPNVHNCIFLTFSHICFASAEHTKETVFCVHAVLISHYLSSLNILMMKLDFFGLEQLAVKGQKKSKYLPPHFPTTNLSPKILLLGKKWNRYSSKSGQIILLSFAL